MCIIVSKVLTVRAQNAQQEGVDELMSSVYALRHASLFLF